MNKDRDSKHTVKNLITLPKHPSLCPVPDEARVNNSKCSLPFTDETKRTGFKPGTKGRFKNICPRHGSVYYDVAV